MRAMKLVVSDNRAGSNRAEISVFCARRRRAHAHTRHVRQIATFREPGVSARSESGTRG
jgi:hypothetical protein